MTSRMVGSVLTLVILLSSVVGGAAQTYTQMQWGVNKGVTPYAFGANIDGTWRTFGTISSAGVWNLTIPALPGLSTNVVSSVGMPGLDMANCTSTATCGWFLYSSPTAYPAANTPTLRVQKFSPATGGPGGGFVNSAVTVFSSSGVNNPEYLWGINSTVFNTTLLAQNAENVGLAGTVRKELGSSPAGSMIGASWGVGGQCIDNTAVSNPQGSCVGAEFDTIVSTGGGSADPNRTRVMLQLAGGSNVGAPVTVGRGLLITPWVNATLDNAIELRDQSGFETFIMKGDGSATISSDLGNWSSFNVGKQLVVQPKSLTVGNNPALSILDTNKSNPWSIANSAGDLKFYVMPALNDTSSAPVTALTLARPNGAASFNSSVAIRTNNVLTFADNTGAISGTNGTAILNNAGTTFIDSYSGPFTFRGNAFAVLATLSSTGATFNVLPKIKGSSTGVTAIGTANSSATDYTATLPANTGTIAELNLAQTFSANQTFGATNLRVQGSSTGVTTVGTANSSATDYTATLPANTGTIAETNLAQTFTATQTFSSGISVANLAVSAAAPTISSGFGTSPSVTANNGTAAFRINVGTGGTATNGVVGLPTAANGWNCFASDITTPATGHTIKQSAGTTTSVTLTNYNNAGTATAWAASDIIIVNCMAY